MVESRADCVGDQPKGAAGGQVGGLETASCSFCSPCTACQPEPGPGCPDPCPEGRLEPPRGGQGRLPPAALLPAASGSGEPGDPGPRGTDLLLGPASSGHQVPGVAGHPAGPPTRAAAPTPRAGRVSALPAPLTTLAGCPGGWPLSPMVSEQAAGLTTAAPWPWGTRVPLAGGSPWVPSYPLGQDPPVTSFGLNPLFQGCISEHSHVLRP